MDRIQRDDLIGSLDSALEVGLKSGTWEVAYADFLILRNIGNDPIPIIYLLGMTPTTITNLDTGVAVAVCTGYQEYDGRLRIRTYDSVRAYGIDNVAIELPLVQPVTWSDWKRCPSVRGIQLGYPDLNSR
jgi:hypothetical protein